MKLLPSTLQKLDGNLCKLPHPAIDLCTIRLGKSLSHEACVALSQQVTHNEIDRALFWIDDNKNSGLDGFNDLFFKKCWTIIKQDVYAGFVEFFHTGFIHHPINNTAITLLPKVVQATHVKDFRPISCCSVLFNLKLSYTDCIMLL